MIIEGGGMKATFANGVLASFERAGYRPWHTVYGNSAGGALAAWHAAGQAEFAQATWKYALDPRIVNYRRALLRRGPLLDHAALLEIVYRNEHPLDVEAVRRCKHAVRVVAADADTGETVYPDIRKHDVLKWVEATGRLPLGSNGPVEIDGHRYLDGGCTDPLPIQRAIDDGHTDILILMNQPPGIAEKDAKWFVKKASAKYPALAEDLAAHIEHKRAAWALAANPPQGVTVTLLHPKEPTGLHRLSRDLDALQRVLALGRRAGIEFLAQHN